MSLYRRSMLFTAIRSNDITTIQTILTTKRAQWSYNGMDFHMVRKAVEFNRREIMELLLDYDCRVNLPSFIGDSPLHLAVAKPKSYALVKRLMQQGADVNHRNRWNETPIQVAFASGAEKRIMKLLLAAYLQESSINETNDVGLSYLHIACATTDLDYVWKFVEEGGADVNARVKEGRESYMHAGSTPLHMAVEFGKTEVIEYLLQHGADVYIMDGEGSTPIHLALELGETDVIEQLFEYDYTRQNFCNDNGLSHFMAACACSSPEIAKDFLTDKFINGEFFNANEVVDSFGTPNYWLKGLTPLHFAAFFGRMEITKLLLVDGAKCCVMTANNVTPIQIAEENGHQNIADLIRAHCQGYELFF